MHGISPQHISRIWQHDANYWLTMSRATPRDGYVLYTNPALPSRYDPNHAGYFRITDDADAAVAVTEIIAFYDALGCDSVAYLDHMATPVTLTTLLTQHGFVAMHDWGDVDLLVLESFHPPPTDPRITIQRVASVHDIDAWSRLDTPTPDDNAGIMLTLRRTEVSHPAVCGYLALIDGVAAGRCLTYTENHVSRIEAVFVAEAFRRRGVARQLVAHAIASVVPHSEIVYLFAIRHAPAYTLYHTLGMQVCVENAVTTFVRTSAIDTDKYK